MPVEITMPQLSDTMTEGTLVKWLKKEGDKVKGGEVIAEVETDKATMEMESFEGGTLAHIVVKEGDKAPVGATLAVLATGKENPADVKKELAGNKPLAASRSGGSQPSVAQASAPEASIPQSASAQKAPSRLAASAGSSNPSQGGVTTLIEASRGEVHEPDDVGHGATREAAKAVPPLRSTGGNGHSEERFVASPLARRIATDKKINLSEVHGTGPGGRIVQRDVLEFQPSAKTETKEMPQAAPLPPPITSGEKQVITMTKMRVAIAHQLLKSKQTIPHFYETIDIDVEELGKLRERMNQRLEKEKVRLSIADFINKAVAFTLTKHPVLNARFDSAKNEITRYGDVNLGIAVAVPDGLIVPVLRGINRMGLKEIRQRGADLIERARAQKLRREEQTEGTFTISSLGTMGIREFSAIINPPEVGILAVGSAEKRAVVKGDTVVARTMLTVTLSADHRVVDGADAAQFLSTLKAMLEEPGMMLL